MHMLQHTHPLLLASLFSHSFHLVFTFFSPLMPQELQLQLSVISHAFEAEIATAISGSSSSVVSQLSTSSASSTLTVASGCARGDDGSVRVQFYVSAANITREIDGLLSSRRRLQSTPCSSTDGTSVSPNNCTAMLLPALTASRPQTLTCCGHTAVHD